MAVALAVVVDGGKGSGSHDRGCGGSVVGEGGGEGGREGDCNGGHKGGCESGGQGGRKGGGRRVLVFD